MIVGLVGFAKSGKDTAAANMPGFTRFAFADPLKRDIQFLLDRVDRDINHPETKEFVRPLLVEWGRTARKFDPLFWVKRTMDRMLGYVEERHRINGGGFDNIVLTDVRYKNEYEAIEDAGGRCLYIERTGVGPANEEEEKSIEEILFLYNIPTIHNGGTPEELGKKILHELEVGL